MNNLVLIPLGTVSPYPKDDKNCPGFLIKYKNYNILLDCGNGCTRLLKFPDDLNNLKIFISHFHPDHYGDLTSLIQATLVYDRHNLINTLIELYMSEDNSLDYRLLKSLAEPCPIKINSITKTIKFDDIEITTLVVPHQISCYAFRIDTNVGSVVYSADTGTNNNLREFAKNSDIFICESTFLKGQYRLEDYHLYAYEAATIAKDANVSKLLLTHFWPEIDKEQYVEEAKEIFSNVSAANEGQKLILRR